MQTELLDLLISIFNKKTEIIGDYKIKLKRTEVIKNCQKVNMYQLVMLTEDGEKHKFATDTAKELNHYLLDLIQ